MLINASFSLSLILYFSKERLKHMPSSAERQMHWIRREEETASYLQHVISIRGGNELTTSRQPV